MKKITGIVSLFSLMLACNGSYAQDKINTLSNGFSNPPNSAKPRVWWHWMNGNISKDGIAKDLAWMNRIGIGGFMNFDAAMMTPQIVAKRLSYMDPEWKDAFKFTTKLADSLHLEMAIAGSPGWSESGGSWVPAKDGMKKLVWNQINIKGGQKFAGVLPNAIKTTGSFQNIPFFDALSDPSHAVTPPEYYQDIAVIAYRLPETDKTLTELKAKVTSSAGNFNLSQLTDGNLAATNLLPATTNGENAWIQFNFDKPQTIKAVTVVGGGDKGPFGMFGELADTRSIQSSDDGIHFTPISFIPAGTVLQQTISIPATTAKYFRVTFKNPPPPFSLAAMMGQDTGAPKSSPGTEIAEIVLHTETRIDRFEEKAAFAPASNVNLKGTPSTANGITLTDIIDLTDKVSKDGILNWTAPKGNWTIVRFGYSLIGITNHPASPEATGLEVDKLDAVAVRAYFENYLDQYKSATAELMGDKGGLQYMVTDSWEAGAQNWTANLPAEFAKRRGYNLLPWMPVLTGHIIKSSEDSEQFLWDYRKTLSELVAENHYDNLTKILDERGMKRYSESHENGRALIADGMEVKRTAAIPMSAMWTPGGLSGGSVLHEADIRESASVAHIYGQNLVAAESLTAMGNSFGYSPEILKPTADMELASGLNRFVIHTSVHQPTDDKFPGLGLGPFGQWFTRHETWAEQAKSWTDYLAKSSYLLQQGKFVADVIYYYGEDNNITSLFMKKLPEVPAGYNYDFVNADALINVLTVSNGQIVTPSGMQYKILALDKNSQQMTLKVAKKIKELVEAGAVVVGPKPINTPSLTDDKTAFNSIINELWGAENTIKTIGKGKVYTGQSIQEILNKMNIAPDFEYTKPQADTQLRYVHRTLPEQEIYWINNRNNRVENLEATFRVSGKSVEIWHPDTGKTEAASYSFANGATKVALHLEPNDAVFVIFGENTTQATQVVAVPTETKIATIDGNWNLSFQKERGAPNAITIDKLASWTENKEEGVKYFSGTGTYTKTIDAPKDWFKKGTQLWIDLGEVKNLAEVIVNGKSLGIVWKKPFRVNVSEVLKSGKNTLEIKVTNLWVNRLIGDEQANAKKITYTTMPFYKATSPLLPSGLLSEVSILSIK
ncbi:MAG: hypothetical protein RLZZ540_1776 [Bacteroidota bacterium]|jgi:hypothetical protein